MATSFETSIVCPVLIGRTLQRDLLNRAIAQACDARGQTVLIAGEAGIGKSRLVAEARARFRTRQPGALVLQGRCFEPDSVLPYAPLLDLLRTYLATYPPDDILTTLGPGATELARLLPELALPLPNLAPDPLLDPQQEQRRRAHALLELFAHLAARQNDRATSPLLVIVEDLHWSDEASLEVLLALARRVPALPLLLLLTYRSDELSSELAALLAALDRERLAVEMQLPRLTLDDVDALIRAIFDLPHPLRPAFLEALYAVTEGNPFFIEETLKSLIAAGDLAPATSDWDGLPLSELRLPRSVQLAVQRRLDQVSTEAREVLTLAAVAGRRFDFVLLQSLTGRAEVELVRLIKQLIKAQLVVEESADVFAFRHALTQQAVAADLLARERRALHRAIGEAMERLYATSLDAHLTDLAHHFFTAEAWERALAYARRAGEQAQRLSAPRAAAEQFTRAIAAAHKLSQDPLPEVYRARGWAYELLGDFAAALDDDEQALAVARAKGDRRNEWQSLIALGFLWSARDFTRTGAYFQDALDLADAMGDRAIIAQSLNRLGNWHMMVEQPLEARRRHEEALALFQELDDRRGLAATLDLLGTTTISAGDALSGIAYYEQAIALFRELNDRYGLVSALTMLALCCDQYLASTRIAADTNRIVVSLRHVTEALAIARESGWRSAEALALIVQGQVLSAGGQYGRALESMQAGVAIAIEIEHRQWQIDGYLMLGALYSDLLAQEAAQQHLARATVLAREIGSLYWLRAAAGFQASAWIAQGELERADALLVEVLDRDTPALTMGQRHAWCARAELALAQSDPAQALAILDILLAAAPNMATGEEHAIPRLALVHGQALAALRRASEAEALLRAAQATAQQRGVPWLEWRILTRLAALYHAQGRRDEAETARSAAGAIVADLAASLSDQTLRDTFVRGVEAQMRHIPSPSPRRAAKQAFDGLTAREREVAALIAQGLSNRALAEELILSERTIAKHVENILSKLGFASRAQIAAWAVERGLAKSDR